MDQVKVYLRLLAKHHFWVLVAVASLFGLICWWMAASGLASDTKRSWDTVEGAYKKLGSVGGGQKPANAKFAEGVSEKNDGLKQKVLEEWRERYDAQQKLFKWPDIEDLAADLSVIKPDAPIDANLRRRYMNNAFPKTLEDMVFLTADYLRPKIAPPEETAADGQKKDEEPGAAEGDAALPEGEETEGLVVWNKTHMAQLYERYNLEKHARQQGLSSSLNVRLTQEDVWMLENLAKVVRETDKGAQDVGAVPIKRIDTLDIAQWAINDAMREAPKVRGAEKTVDAGGGGMAGGMTGGGGPTGSGGEATTPTSAEELEKLLDDELLNGRYLNDQGQPLSAGEAPANAEFKLMFVRMKVVIDQRKIPDLLVNCANAPVPVEVVYFRMHEPVTPSGGAPAAAPAPAAGGRGLLGIGAGGAPGGGGGGGAKADDIEATPADVTVEVCGVVQIYNPPDETKLGSGSAADPSKRASALPAMSVKAPRSTQSSGGGGLMGGRQ